MTVFAILGYCVCKCEFAFARMCFVNLRLTMRFCLKIVCLVCEQSGFVSILNANWESSAACEFVPLFPGLPLPARSCVIRALLGVRLNI